jgi:aspartate aminotransferase-like enzyme
MLPRTERLLMGPGSSPAMAAPVLSHLDPDMIAILDDIRSRLGATFRAPDTALAIAISGTGTAGIGAGLGPLAGRIWRVALMGSGSTPTSVQLLLNASKRALRD